MTSKNVSVSRRIWHDSIIDKFMLSIFTHITEIFLGVVKTLFASDLDVMSDEVRQILSNKEDAEKYKQAVKDIEKGDKKRVTITLSDNRTITLVQ